MKTNPAFADITALTGDLPDHWIYAKLAEITETVEKIDPRTDPSNEITYLDIASIDNTRAEISTPKKYIGLEAPSRARQLVRSGDILFSTVRTYLKNIAVVPDNLDGAVASTGFCVVRPFQEIDTRFIFYLMLTDDFLNPLNQLQRGTSYPAVRDSDVLARVIPIAPFEEQRRIVGKIDELLSRLDAGSRSLNSAQAKLKRYRQSILKSAYRGKLTVDWRTAHNGQIQPASLLLERIKEQGLLEAKRAIARLKPIDPTQLPEIPRYWKWVKLGEIAFVTKLAGFEFTKHVRYQKTGTA
jgi:type I restriction enzyme, S subunit